MGSIGRISEVQSGSGRFEIIYTLPNIYPKIVMNEERVFEALGMGPKQVPSERGRTHWAVKDVDLFEVTTRFLYEADNAPVILSVEDMKPGVGGTATREGNWCF